MIFFRKARSLRGCLRCSLKQSQGGSPMPYAIMTLTQIVQDSQDYGSADEHMVSRVFSGLEVEDHSYPGLHVDVKQTVGSSFEIAPLEVSAPVGYRGPMNHDALRQAVEGYYRSYIGGVGRGIRRRCRRTPQNLI